MKRIFAGKGVRAGPLSITETRKLSNIFAARCGMQMQGDEFIPPGMGMPFHPPPFMDEMMMMMMIPSNNGPSRGSRPFVPQFKENDSVPIGLALGDDGGFQLRRKLLGTQASKIKQIISEIASPQSLQIRLRGIGSQFYEGPMGEEFQKPLHFSISAEDSGILQRAVAAITAHISKLV